MFPQLLLPKDKYVQVSICLNRVHLDGITPTEAIAKLMELGYQPELRYQVDPDTEELHLYGVIHEKHLSESEMTQEKCHQLWQAFTNNTILYVIGTPTIDCHQWLAICDLEDFAQKEQEYHQYLDTLPQPSSQVSNPQPISSGTSISKC